MRPFSQSSLNGNEPFGAEAAFLGACKSIAVLWPQPLYNLLQSKPQAAISMDPDQHKRLGSSQRKDSLVVRVIRIALVNFRPEPAAINARLAFEIAEAGMLAWRQSTGFLRRWIAFIVFSHRYPSLFGKQRSAY